MESISEAKENIPEVVKNRLNMTGGYVFRHIGQHFSSLKYCGIFIVLSLLQGNSGHAQFYESGTEPASVRWKQINTEHFRVIFPDGANSEGQHAANALEYIHKAGGKSLNHHPGKISVVLHNRPAISNGFVSWAPKRSEWYLTPPQDSYAHNWLEQLAVHEYRHVVQVDKLNQGFTRALEFAVGQQGTGMVSGLLPLWFLEGDAVAAETALTHTGRGRNPSFEMPLRTIALSGQYMKYDKALFGSYRDFVPNHYELGYQMVAWSRNRYGRDLFEAAINTVAREPYYFFLYPFRLGLKKKTGLNTEQIYEHAFNNLTIRWRKQQEQTGYDSRPAWNIRKNRLYTSYRSPQYLNDSLILAKREGMAHIAQWVTVDRYGNERVIFTPGAINSEYGSYSSGYLVWTELVQDIRWSNRSYSVVKVFDLSTGREWALKRHTRFFSPALSPDGKTVAVVDVPVEGESSIVLLDTFTGEEKGRIGNPGSTHLQMPSWSCNGEYILAIANNKEGKSIVKADIVSGTLTGVLIPTYDDISHPVDAGEYALFTGYYNGITNVYAVNYHTNEISQVTLSRFGAFDPQPDASGNKMLYAEYSADGYDLVEKPLDAAQWIPAGQLSNHSVRLYEPLARQEQFNMQDSIIPDAAHAVRPFRKWAHLFNVHSWAPLYYEVNTSDIMSTRLYPGLVLLSQDLLGNMTSSAGYSWRGYNAFHANFSYRGLYPVIDFRVDRGGQKAVYGSPDNSIGPREQNRNMEVSVRSYIPFVLTRNRYITGITPQITLSYSSSYLYSPSAGDYQHGLLEVGYSFNAYRYLKPSLRDLAPRFGGILQAAYYHTPANTGQLGHIYCIYGRMYIPGIGRHHSLQLSGAWQEQKTKYFLFGTRLNFPRGYANGRTEKLALGSIEYALPLFYPDCNLGFLVYLKRVRASLFCDAGKSSYRQTAATIGQPTWVSDRMLGLGTDLLADVNLLRIHFPVSIGIRTVYVPDRNRIQPSLLLNVALN